jgi:ATP-dependent DNA ligase
MVKRDLRPMLATLTDKPFDGADWVFETKWDGFRALAVAAPNHAALYSREWPRHLPEISDDLRRARQGFATRR